MAPGFCVSEGVTAQAKETGHDNKCGQNDAGFT
ncbi:hypothetical protein JOE56_002082 [Brevibacterium paucivorans]|uniref:Uncharacterized protein n=1 Tax=Brevibacterium paucivorans TaxID=170994 RepID=A0ABS2SQ65_9MICO|nr:hypothetical protein [Brevibacterium paucivorans]